MNIKARDDNNGCHCHNRPLGSAVSCQCASEQVKIDALVKDLEALEEVSNHLQESRLSDIKLALYQYELTYKKLPHLPDWFLQIMKEDKGL
jgi:hypothetical protein